MKTNNVYTVYLVNYSKTRQQTTVCRLRSFSSVLRVLSQYAKRKLRCYAVLNGVRVTHNWLYGLYDQIPFGWDEFGRIDPREAYPVDSWERRLVG